MYQPTPFVPITFTPCTLAPCNEWSYIVSFTLLRKAKKTKLMFEMIFLVKVVILNGSKHRINNLVRGYKSVLHHYSPNRP